MLKLSYIGVAAAHLHRQSPNFQISTDNPIEVIGPDGNIMYLTTPEMMEEYCGSGGNVDAVCKADKFVGDLKSEVDESMEHMRQMYVF